MMRCPSLLRAICVAWLLLLPFACARAAESPVELIGLSREEVITLRGRPTGERQRGDERLMVYPDGLRVTLREDKVVAVSGGAEGEIVGSDGTRYKPGADGNLQRNAAPVSSPTAAEPVEPPTTDAVVSDSDMPAEAAASPDLDDELDADLPPGAEVALPPGLPTEALEAHVSAMESGSADEPEMSKGKSVLILALGAGFRFAFALLVLRIALHVIGVPFFWPDLLKVTLLYLAVRELLHGLGGLGGWWEFIPIFKIDDVVSFLVLACSLTWFKIAGSGLTALKIAAATKLVVVGLMLAAGLAITFGLSAMQ